MTIREWCEKNDVSKYRYNYRNKRVRENLKAGEEPTFAEITPILSPVDTASQNLVLSSDFQISFKSIQVTVPSHFNPAALAGLMKVLQEL